MSAGSVLMLAITPVLGPVTRCKGRFAGRGRSYRQLALAHVTANVEGDDLNHLSPREQRRVVPDKQVRKLLAIKED